MKEAFAMKDRLVFMDVIVDPTENVYPMIEAGRVIMKCICLLGANWYETHNFHPDRKQIRRALPGGRTLFRSRL